MNTQVRANKGGETGLNGEFYPGGTFLPNTTLKKMAMRTKGNGSRKVQVEPYVWVVDDRRPIFSLAGGVAKYDWNTKTLAPYLPAFHEDGSPRLGAGNETLSATVELCNRFNAGERWVTA